MSTSYYLRRKPSQDEITNLVSLVKASVDGSNFNEILDKVSMMYKSDRYANFADNECRVIQIGHRACGQKFSWSCNLQRRIERTSDDNYETVYSYLYPLSKEGITEFIMRDEFVVVDEYGEVLDKREFLDMAFNWCLDGKESSMEANRYYDFTNEQEPFKKLGYNFRNNYQCDLIIDGLRFTII